MSRPQALDDRNDLDDLAGQRLLVLGDVILDRYVVGDVPRISPEAPVPVVKVSDEECRVGGAANVAANLAALGAKVKLLGVVGRDSQAEVLKERVRAHGVSVADLLTDASRPTVQKTRVVARHQQVLRVDREKDGDLSPAMQERLLARLKKGLAWAQGILLSDYGKGVLTPALIQAAVASGLPVYVDPKGRDYRRYRGATLVTPNAREAAEATGLDTGDRDGCRKAAQRLLKEARLESVVITRGAQGIYFRSRGGVEGNVPARARGVFDVTGAGDTVIAVLALACTAGRSLEQGLLLANAAAGVVVERLGAAVVTREELSEALLGRTSTAAKITTVGKAAGISRALRARGRRVVLTNGCFDLLHPGHVESLEFARSQGEFLMVAVNEDASVRRQKDDLRPVQDLAARLRVLAGLECVGLVFSFAEDTPDQVVRALTPHVLVKGEDWKEKGVVGQDWVESHGGQVVLAPLMGGHSTTAIIQHIQRHANGKGRGARRGHT